MENVLIVIAVLVGMAFGYMVGRHHGLMDGVDETENDPKTTREACQPPRDARGRFIKRK